MRERYHNSVMDELVFEVTQEADGGFFAECLTDSIVTQGNTWEELRKNVREVVRAFYFDQPERIQSRLWKTWRSGTSATSVIRAWSESSCRIPARFSITCS